MPINSTINLMTQSDYITNLLLQDCFSATWWRGDFKGVACVNAANFNNREVSMGKRSAWRRIALSIGGVLLLGGCCCQYTDSNPLPVRVVSPPTGGEWACQPVSGGPCQTSPNYEGKIGCNNGGSTTVCKTVSGNCQCVPR